MWKVILISNDGKAETDAAPKSLPHPAYSVNKESQVCRLLPHLGDIG